MIVATINYIKVDIINSIHRILYFNTGGYDDSYY